MKFEAGKKYKFKHVPDTVYECLFVCPKGQGVFVKQGFPDSAFVSGSPRIYHDDEWTEYIEPRSGTIFLNVYANNYAAYHLTREKADDAAGKGCGRLACVEVHWTEGQGLDVCQGNCTCAGGQPCGKSGCKQ